MLQTADLCNSSGVKHGHPITDLRRECEVMGDQQHRHSCALTKFAQQLNNLVLSRHIETGCRLVRDEKARFA